MASDHRRHYAHPQHLVMRTYYNGASTHIYHICGSKVQACGPRRLSLQPGPSYNAQGCEFNIHESCTNYFEESASFFVHPCGTPSR
ncbi:hypothetical protein PR202_gb21606 [Eleusine coracana subsp. coracana]|uniref:Uncharacterized protein n=1 Tax=Eleusine coracana subsp. coracana TaxID=191504 RepID=A0AAV5FE15_ELECO|nr:hypothetical protein PR202_gb21606 [Eleusine coracana subsp. coracana]